MKYSVQNYARALVEVLAAMGDGLTSGRKVDRQSAIAKRFLALVRRNGDEPRLKKILDEASRLAREAGGDRLVTIASARPLTASQKKAVHALVKPSDIVREKIDGALVAGVKITVNDEMQFDGTLKSKLDTLFNV